MLINPLKLSFVESLSNITLTKIETYYNVD